MQKILAWIGVLLIVISSISTACSQAAAVDEPGLVSAQVTTPRGSLNLRSAPDNNATVLDRIPNGSTVTVIQQGDTYWEIQYGGVQGYAMCDYLTAAPQGGTSAEANAPDTQETAQQEQKQTAQQAGQIAQVVTEIGPLNLRSHPQSGATVLLRIPNRSLVTVISQNGEYWEIAYDSTQGYASSEFLTMTDYTPDILDYRLLYRGNQGNDVVALKERLMELGYYRDGSTMNNTYNETCVDRVKLFQRENGLKEDGISTAEVQAKLFSASATVNTEPLPAPKRSSYIVASSASNIATGALGDYDNTDWDQWMLDHPGVCPCCMGSGCACCNYTGKI